MTLAAAVALTSVTFATAQAAAPDRSGTTPEAKPSITVTLTQDEMSILKRALELAAGTCQTQVDGCVVGANRNAILNTLSGAKPVESSTKQ